MRIRVCKRVGTGASAQFEFEQHPWLYRYLGGK